MKPLNNNSLEMGQEIHMNNKSENVFVSCPYS